MQLPDTHRIAEMRKPAGKAKPLHPRAHTAPKVSKRNRHTGRINAYKQRILDNAKTLFMLDDRGVEYGVLAHKAHAQDMSSPIGGKFITVSQIVKAAM